MSKLFKQAMKFSRNLNVFEIGLFKLYLIAVTLILAIWFPVLLSLNVYFYLTVFVVLDIIVLVLLIKKEGNFLKKIFGGKKGYKVFQNYSMFDFGLFKVTLIAFGLLLAKVFPVLLNIDLGYYLTVFGIGLGYFVGGIFSKKKSKK